MQPTLPETESIWRLVAEASPLVQAVMLVLVLASLLSWYLIIRRAAVLRQHEREAQQFRQRFRQQPDLGQLFDESGEAQGLAGVFHAGFGEYRQQRQAGAAGDGVDRMLQVAISEREQRLEQGLNILATIGSVSPYIGLFGTVWGIMNAFLGLSRMGQATLAAVAPGIAEALIATAIGLFAAIPAVMAYNRLSARCQRLVAGYYSFGNELQARLQRQAV